MTMRTIPGTPSVTLEIRQSPRARTARLSVSRLDGQAVLTVPRSMNSRAAWDFALDHADWLRAQIAQVAPRRVVGPGTILPLLGRPRRVVEGPRAGLSDVEISCSPRRPAGPQVRAVVLEAAREALASASARHAAALGRPFGRITLRDTRSRWGSCTSRGDLMYSWRLALAPLDVLDYVAAHEVAHLAHMDHSPAFWHVVARLCPGHAQARAWLRTNAGTLHAWDFGD